MDIEGPPLALLTARIADTPADFLPASGTAGEGTVAVAVDAVLHDLCAMRGFEVPAATFAALSAQGKAAPAWRRLSLLLAWLLAEPALRWPQRVDAVLELLLSRAEELSAQVKSAQWLADEERREELARLALLSLGQRPAGESVVQARDRWQAISSTERARLVAASRAAEQRAREIREALARKAAEESADKWSRE